ncbi:MAG TPA: ATP synthase F1 subunit epsilon [Planctomycetota bacterium]|nr:ATP synthase F1 subunit epsilon [Planctomycetota bacterium]
MATQQAGIAARPGAPSAGGTDAVPDATQDLFHAGRLWVEVRSPDGVLFAGWADSVVVPGALGSMGILPRHAALMSSLVVGLTKVRASGGREIRLVTGAGFLEIARNRVLLLVDFADDPARVDRKRAAEARDRAQQRLRTPAENVDLARAEAALDRALMRLRFAGEPRL